MHVDKAACPKPNVRNNGRLTLKIAMRAVLVTAIAYVIYDLTQQDYSNRSAFGFTAIGIWAFGVTAFIVVHLCRPSTGHRMKKAAILLLVYLGAYVYFTSVGAYYFSQSGTARYSSGLSISNVSIWHPRFLYWAPFKNIFGQSTSRGSTLGYYYSPLIIVDRKWFHPTQQLIADDFASEAATKHHLAVELWPALNHIDHQPPQPADGERSH